jgi:hypothetical protein
VQKVSSTNFAFAAIWTDGSVVAWGFANWGGDAEWGGDTTGVDLTEFQDIYPTHYGGFAALMPTGYLQAWGGQNVMAIDVQPPTDNGYVFVGGNTVFGQYVPPPSGDDDDGRGLGDDDGAYYYYDDDDSAASGARVA